MKVHTEKLPALTGRFITPPGARDRSQGAFALITRAERYAAGRFHAVAGKFVLLPGAIEEAAEAIDVCAASFIVSVEAMPVFAGAFGLLPEAENGRLLFKKGNRGWQ